MEKKNTFISIKTKIMLSTLIPVILSFLLICSIIFSSLFNSLHETAEAEFLQLGQKYAVGFESTINHALNYLTVIASILEHQVGTDLTDRERLQKTVFAIFNNYELIDGTSIYFEPNAYDGQDGKYKSSFYGTETSGRICYYFYKDEGKTAYLPEALADEIEFTLPHYTQAKEENRPVYTEPAVYEIDGRHIPMFTLTYPVQNGQHEFIGAVTVDLFLEDLYAQIRNEQIYETGYVIIVNDKNQIIYSPYFEDIGSQWEDTGGKSIINGKDIFVSQDSIYIPQLDSHFYVSVAAPKEEINAEGIRLLTALITLSILVIGAIAGLLYYLIGRISRPIKDITGSANRIAGGDLAEMSAIMAAPNKKRAADEVDILSEAIREMLAQINQVQVLRLEAMEMKHQKEKAEETAQAKNDFLAKMSHEIRTPMNAVMGMTELILRKDLPQDVYESAMMIKSASVNLLSIINDILDFSKIESGKLEIIENDYMLPSLIHDVVSVIRVRLMDVPIQFAVFIEPTLPASLIGDEIRLRQMIINLLSNGVKYTKEGYISLSVRGQTHEDYVSLSIEVADSGIGIKEEDIHKLFGNFVQIDTVKNRGIEGTGLGLAITRELCRLMGGDIRVSSEYGQGSLFTVTLNQKFTAYTPFATVDNLQEKSVLLYEPRQVYKDSLLLSLEALAVDYKNVDDIPALFDNMETYDYLFVASFAYGSVGPALSKLSKAPKVVLLSDITEASAPKNARILALPAHALSIANVLNGIYEDYGGGPIIGASFTAPEAKVLIVDDIEANLKVGEGLLLPYEMQVTLCSGGSEAIELVSKENFDIVLMDHMMPEMDGLEATRRIRALEGEEYQALPIIALTANAVSGVKEMFVQNGMNDFLSKPVETAKLDALLSKWIPVEKRRKIGVISGEEGYSELVEALKNVAELNIPRALSVVGGSADTYERIVRLSTRLLPDSVARLNKLLYEDFPNYSIEIHGMKSVLNNIGCYDLGTKAYELEKLAKAGDEESCYALHPAFIEKLQEFSARMNEILDQMTEADKSPGDIRLLPAVIGKLEAASELFDSATALEILESISDFTYGEHIDPMLAELNQGFENFDFDTTAELLNKLKGAIEEDV